MTWEADVAQQRFTKLIGNHFDTWGFTKEEWLSPGFWTSRIHPEDFPNVAEACGTAITKQVDKHFECRMTTAEGTVMWFDGLVGPIIEHGMTVGLRGSLADTTNRALRGSKESKIQQMDAVGRLAGGVAHDFNNLLTVIKTYSDLIAFGADSSDPNTRYVHAIRIAVDRAVALTDQLLLFSTQSVGSKSTVDLNSVLLGVDSTLRSMVGNVADLTIDLDPKLRILRGDQGSLEQVIVNLARNSCDAIHRLDSGDGGSHCNETPLEGSQPVGRITLRTRNTLLVADAAEVQADGLEPGEYVELLCIDDGGGMRPDVLVRAFEPFFSTNDIGHGQGIGLTVVYGIVQQLNGSVSIQSEEGKGTTVRVLLPLARLDPDQEPSPIKDQPSRGTETVLVVEDDSDTRHAEELILSRLGYRVLVASDPLEALAIVDEHEDIIHLLITDVEMPVMFGQELARQVRPRLPGLRVLFTSGYSAQALETELLGEHFLAKPFALSTLASSVRAVLDTPAANVSG